MKNSMNTFIWLKSRSVILLKLTLVCLFFSGCIQRNVSSQITIIPFLPEENTFLFSENYKYFDAFQIKDVAVFNIKKFIPFDEGYLLLSPTAEGQIHLINGNGNMELSFARQGKGPEEFLSVSDVAIYNNHIYVLNPAKSEIIVFDKTGRFFKAIETPGPFDNLAVYQEGQIALYRDVAFSDNDFHFQILDVASGKIVSRFLAVEPISEHRSFPQNTIFSVVEGQVLAFKTNTNQVFDLHSNMPSVKYSFDLDGKGVPDDILKDEKIDLFDFVGICRNSEYIWSVANYSETNDFTSFFYRFKGDVYLNRFNKENETSKSYSEFYDDLFSGIESPINEGFYPLFFSDRCDYFFILPDQFDEELSEKLLPDGLCQKHGRNNPIIVRLYK